MNFTILLMLVFSYLCSCVDLKNDCCGPLDIKCCAICRCYASEEEIRDGSNECDSNFYDGGKCYLRDGMSLDFFEQSYCKNWGCKQIDKQGCNAYGTKC